MKKGTWSTDEVERLRSMCSEGCTKAQACKALDRSLTSIQNKACQIGAHFLRDNGWGKKDDARLRALASDGKSPQEVAELMERSVQAIRTRASRIGVVLLNGSKFTGMQNRMWSLEDRELLKELWLDDTVTTVGIARRLRRGKKAVQSQASDMGLGPRSFGGEDLTPQDISREMGVSMSLVYYWMTNGLKYKERKIGTSSIIISQSSLLAYLEEHETRFDASRISHYLFLNEPQWLVNKRLSDKQCRPANHRTEWTDEDDKRLVKLHSLGMSDEEIAFEMQRTSWGIQARRSVLFLSSPKKWTPEEVAVLKSCGNIDELCALLPHRSRVQIKSKLQYMKMKECIE